MKLQGCPAMWARHQEMARHAVQVLDLSKWGGGSSPALLHGHGLVEALEPILGLLEWVHRSSLHLGIRVPLLVLLLIKGSIRFARPISGDIESLDIMDTILAHADLGEDVLAHGAKLAPC